MRRSAVIAIIVVVMLSLPAAAAVTGSFERTLQVSGPVQLEVKTGSGDISIRKGEDKSVRVYGRIRAHEGLFGGDPREKVRKLEKDPPIQQSGNLIRIGHVNDHELFNNVSISYEIVVPAETRVTANTGSGKLELERVQGPAKLNSGSGNITVTGIDDRVEAEAGSGSLDLSMIKGDVVAHTGSGHIKIERVGSVDAHTGSGGMEILDMKGRLRAETGSGDVHVEGTPTGDWKVQTGSGRVTLRVGGNAGFDLRAHTGSGNIDTDLPVTVSGRQDRHELNGKVRGGGPLVEMRTGSGNLRIE
ncbi:MAG TPA: DUF4097 family beta strand repeat-containing protein [Terriglobales bacterium]|nr:DUF4097 family beta strand repeat-containing protein [Terriglobales bacterium]